MDASETGRNGRITFTLDGAAYELSRAEVDQRLRGVGAESSARHGVLVNQTWYPVKQAFEVALGVPRVQFTSEAARRHLGALGYPMRGQVERRARAVPPEPAAEPDQPAWHAQTLASPALVSSLVSSGWQVVSAANTGTKERGVDVVAERDGRTVGIGVKGFPGAQAVNHWYAEAVLAAMRLRTRRPGLDSVIALPDVPRYRDLVTETWSSLTAAGIDVWWLREDGTVEPHGHEPA